MSRPIQINTNIGVLNLYIIKFQTPIIGDYMTEPRSVIIVETQTSRYCGFLSDHPHTITDYNIESSNSSQGSKLYIEKAHRESKRKEENLIMFPSKRLGQINATLNDDSYGKHHKMIIDFVACEKECTISLTSVDTETYKMLTFSFQITVYEYEKITEIVKQITSKDFLCQTKPDHGMDNPRLLNMLNKINGGCSFDDFILERPPKYELTDYKDALEQPQMKKSADEYDNLIDAIANLKRNYEALKQENIRLEEENILLRQSLTQNE